VAARSLLTFLLFALTLLAVLRRPRGWHEAWWTCAAAACALLFGLVQPTQALAVLAAAKDALLFLLALLVLSLLLDKSGFFEWAALLCARAAQGEGRRLFRNFLFLGALVTIALSLDTTAVLLTPVVLVCAQRASLPAKPFVILCALLSNVASLLLPVSNLTNLLLVHLTGASFGGFFRVQLLPQTVVLAVLWAGLAFVYRREIAARFDVTALPDPAAVVSDRVFFRGAQLVLGVVLVGYFIASEFSLPVYAVAFAGVLALLGLAAARGLLRLSWLGELQLGIFPFVAGLFILVRAVENLGLEEPARRFLAVPHGALAVLVGSSISTALLSNVVNNLPAVLLAQGTLAGAGAGPEAVYGVLLGANVGPCFGVYGSLATVLVLAEARRRGVEVRGMELARVGVWLTPLMLGLGVAALWLVLHPWGLP